MKRRAVRYASDARERCGFFHRKGAWHCEAFAEPDTHPKDSACPNSPHHGPRCACSSCVTLDKAVARMGGWDAIVREVPR